VTPRISFEPGCPWEIQVKSGPSGWKNEKTKREMSGIMVIGWDNDFSVKKGFLNYNKTRQNKTRTMTGQYNED